MSTPSDHSHPLFGLLFLGCGVLILLVAIEVIPPKPGSVHAPRWVLGLCGLAFAAAGGSMLGHRWPLVRSLCLSACILGLGGVAAWAAVLAPAEGWSGGLPFMPAWVNVAFARGLAGFGALLCFGLLLYGWKTGFRSAGATTLHDRSDP